MRACQHAPKRNFDDPLTAIAHQYRHIDRIMERQAEEAVKDLAAVRMLDRLFTAFAAFVVGLAVMWLLIRMM